MKWLFYPSYGLIKYFWYCSVNWLTAPQTVSIIVITIEWKSASFVRLVFLDGLQNISPSYYEAAN
ncbi:sugar ABC transporter permease [Listeria monocytogenes]|nr:sugar ABC transporter permease [Listeria monocytogenes]